MTFGCGNYKCVNCYPFTYGCEMCREDFPAPVPNGSPFQCECGWITNKPEKKEKQVSNEELTECECDPCGDENCSCRGKRCDFCKSQEDKTVEPDFATELQRIVQKERDRIADNLLEHNKVCNYKSVTEEDCDVCHYLSQAAKLIRTGEDN